MWFDMFHTTWALYHIVRQIVVWCITMNDIGKIYDRRLHDQNDISEWINRSTVTQHFSIETGSSSTKNINEFRWNNEGPDVTHSFNFEESTRIIIRILSSSVRLQILWWFQPIPLDSQLYENRFAYTRIVKLVEWSWYTLVVMIARLNFIQYLHIKRMKWLKYKPHAHATIHCIDDTLYIP